MIQLINMQIFVFGLPSPLNELLQWSWGRYCYETDGRCIYVYVVREQFVLYNVCWIECTYIQRLTRQNWHISSPHVFSSFTIINEYIYRISHVLWCDMIFILWVMCFLYPVLGEKTYNELDKNHKSHHKLWEILFITHLAPTYLFCILYSLDFVA
jgi:hypothetical protein